MALRRSARTCGEPQNRSAGASTAANAAGNYLTQSGVQQEQRSGQRHQCTEQRRQQLSRLRPVPAVFTEASAAGRRWTDYRLYRPDQQLCWQERAMSGNRSSADTGTINRTARANSRRRGVGRISRRHYRHSWWWNRRRATTRIACPHRYRLAVTPPHMMQPVAAVRAVLCRWCGWTARKALRPCRSPARHNSANDTVPTSQRELWRICGAN